MITWCLSEGIFIICLYLHIFSYFCQVGFSLIFSSCLIATKIWNDRPKRLKQQRSYNSVQIFYETDTPNTWKQAKPEGIIFLIHLGYLPFILPISFFWLYFVQNRACAHHQSMKENANGHMFKAS